MSVRRINDVTDLSGFTLPPGGSKARNEPSGRGHQTHVTCNGNLAAKPGGRPPRVVVPPPRPSQREGKVGFAQRDSLAFTSTNKRSPHRGGFTIIELLIAMAATLLIMAALTKSYGLIGNRVTDNRAAVKMSSETRDAMYRLRTELEASTASRDPSQPATGTGYFMYMDGPMTDTTTTTYTGADPAILAEEDFHYFPLSRFGDTDDYLAMTVKAAPGVPFVGKVPWGILEARKAAFQGASYSVPANYDPRRLVPIQSEYAEVAYWLAPEPVRDITRPITPVDPWQLVYRNDDGQADGMLEANSPAYVDNTSLTPGFNAQGTDGFPDRFLLYRRVLLIRPDLNVSASQLGGRAVGFPAGQVSLVGYLLPNGNVEPAGNSVPQLNPGVWDPGDGSIFGLAPNWLVGMGRVQQEMDLSVAREFNYDSNTGRTDGRPSRFYSASSLEQLRDPHRRFAHVMAPGRIVSGMPVGVNQGCSMPLLALSPPNDFLAAGPLPIQGINPATKLTDNGTPASRPGICDQFTMIGNLRPEFALAGIREGEDIVAARVAAFDVQIREESSPQMVDAGGDGAPGAVGVDDDLDGAQDNLSELGWFQSDDRVLTVNDPAAYSFVRNQAGQQPGTIVQQSFPAPTFVDLGCAQSPGGNVRALHPRFRGSQVAPALLVNIASPISGLEYDFTYASLFVSRGMQRSGKFVIRQNGWSYLQPTYDTWTENYESDGLNQVRSIFPSNNRVYNTASAQTTYWTFNGLANGGTPPSDTPPAFNNDNDLGDPRTYAGFIHDGQAAEASDTTPPVDEPLSAIRVRMRLYDEASAQVDELELISDLR